MRGDGAGEEFELFPVVCQENASGSVGEFFEVRFVYDWGGKKELIELQGIREKIIVEEECVALFYLDYFFEKWC